MALIASIAAPDVAHQRELAQDRHIAHGRRRMFGRRIFSTLAMAFPLADPFDLRGGLFLGVFTYSLLALFDCLGFLRTERLQMPEWFSAFLKRIDKEGIDSAELWCVATFLTTLRDGRQDTSAVSPSSAAAAQAIARCAVVHQLQISSNHISQVQIAEIFICGANRRIVFDRSGGAVTRIERSYPQPVKYNNFEPSNRPPRRFALEETT